MQKYSQESQNKKQQFNYGQRYEWSLSGLVHCILNAREGLDYMKEAFYFSPVLLRMRR